MKSGISLYVLKNTVKIFKGFYVLTGKYLP